MIVALIVRRLSPPPPTGGRTHADWRGGYSVARPAVCASGTWRLA